MPPRPGDLLHLLSLGLLLAKLLLASSAKSFLKPFETAPASNRKAAAMRGGGRRKEKRSKPPSRAKIPMGGPGGVGWDGMGPSCPSLGTVVNTAA